MRALVAVLVLCVLCFPTRRVSADAADVFGLEPRVSAMGGAGTALTHSATAAYYNPAAIVGGEGNTLLLGVTGARTFFPASTDVVVGYDGETPLVSDVANDTDPVAGITMAAAIRLGSRLGVGLLLYHPGQRTLRVRSQDPFIPTYTLYDNAQQRFTLNVGLGVRAVSWLRAGVGASILTTNRFDQSFDLAAGAEDSQDSRGFLGLDVVPVAVPTAGISIDLARLSSALESMSLGMAFRGQVELPVAIAFVNGAEVVVSAGPSSEFRLRTVLAGNIPLTGHFAPAKLSVGWSWDDLSHRWSTAASVTWLQWSRFRAPDLDPLFDPLVLEPLGELTINWRRPPAENFRDILMGGVGVEWRTARGNFARWAIRGGYAFEPTPAPRQTGETNRLDANKHILTAGAGLELANTGPSWPPLKIDWYAQLHVLSGDTASKRVRYDCADASERPPVGYPCVGEIGSSGQIIATGASLTLEF